MSEVSRVISSGGRDRINIVQRLIGVACGAIGMDAGIVAVRQADHVRIAAVHGIPQLYFMRSNDLKNYPYKPDEVFLVRDARDMPELHFFLAASALETTGSMLRVPLRVKGLMQCALVLFSREPRPGLSDKDVALVRSVGRTIVEMVNGCILEPGFVHSLGLTFAELRQQVEDAEVPTFLLDSALSPVCANAAATALFKPSVAQALGGPGGCGPDILRNVDFYLQRTIDTGFSTPEIDITLPSPCASNALHRFRVMGSPVTPIDQTRPLIVKTMRPIVEPTMMAMVDNHDLLSTGMVTVDFLTKTLVQRRRHHTRGHSSYITLRSWRRSIREHQITALRAIKLHHPALLADLAAEEIAEEVRTLIGASAFNAVAAVPCGHSPDGKCLSHAIALAVGRKLDLPVVGALKLKLAKGSSHPKTNLTRSRMHTDVALDGSILLVDDVSTSGEHLDEARSLLLRTCKSVFAIAWIGGDAE